MTHAWRTARVVCVFAIVSLLVATLLVATSGRAWTPLYTPPASPITNQPRVVGVFYPSPLAYDFAYHSWRPDLELKADDKQLPGRWHWGSFHQFAWPDPNCTPFQAFTTNACDIKIDARTHTGAHGETLYEWPRAEYFQLLGTSPPSRTETAGARIAASLSRVALGEPCVLLAASVMLIAALRGMHRARRWFSRGLATMQEGFARDGWIRSETGEMFPTSLPCEGWLLFSPPEAAPTAPYRQLDAPVVRVIPGTRAANRDRARAQLTMAYVGMVGVLACSFAAMALRFPTRPEHPTPVGMYPVPLAVAVQ